MTMLTRRSLIRASAQLTLLAPLAPLARIASAATGADARFVLVVLRGGLDGLAAVPPYGDPQYAGARGDLAVGKPGAANGALDLDGTFGLHPALVNLHALYRAGEANVLHAVATPYRERSHFDAQNVLEGGGLTPNGAAGGWLNRALAELGRAGKPRDAVAVASSVPLVLRGEFAVSSWAPSRLPEADSDLIERVRAMYAAVDSNLAARLDDALGARAMVSDAGVPERMRAGGGANVGPLATAAGRFLAAPEGPRVAVIDVGGWDTHANQGGAEGTLAARLRGLDTGLLQLKNELGSAWRDTVVLVVTEFGRTVAVNGTRGTDHGTAGCAFLAGGAVRGGRVVADWPGLGTRELHQGRDLRATTDLRSVFKGVMLGALGVPEAALESQVFPASAAAKPVTELMI
jgi:uncharacterized protein (DUF1501 family)